MSENGNKGDATSVVNAIDDSIVPTVRGVPALELEPQRSTNPVRIVRKRTVDELDRATATFSGRRSRARLADPAHSIS
jgi:hypothetical protein